MVRRSGVAGELPGVDLVLQRPRIGDAAIQALAREDADLDFGHVQPAGVLGGVVELDPAQQPGSGALARARPRTTS